MRNNLLKDAYNFISTLTYSKLMCIKRTGLFYCRGVLKGKLNVKKGKYNIEIKDRSDIRKCHCGLLT